MRDGLIDSRLNMKDFVCLLNVFLCCMSAVFALCQSHQETASLEMVKYKFSLGGTPLVQIT